MWIENQPVLGRQPSGAVYSGKEAVTRYWEDFFRGSPGATLEIDGIYGLGLRCVMRWKYEWIDAAGARRHVRASDLFQVENDVIREHMSYLKGACGEE